MEPEPANAVDPAAADARLAVALAHAGEDPFVSIVGATRTSVVITDPRRADNPIVYVNDSFCYLTGYAREEAVGRNCRFLQGPETDPKTVAAIRAAIAAGRPLEIDIRNYRRDGTPFWNRVGFAPVFTADHEVAFFFASQNDVTAARSRVATLARSNADLAAEAADHLEAQRLSETRLRFATEAAAIGVWELSLPDLVLTATPTVNAVYGLPPGPPSHTDVRDMIHPDDAPRVLATLDRAIRSGAPYQLVYRINRSNGRIGWIDAHGEVDFAADGTPERLRGVAQDITARRESEFALELSAESLRLAADAGQIGTWDLDLTTDTLAWSDRTKAMFGISPDVPCSMADFYGGLHPDDRDATATAFAAATDPAIRSVYDVEYRTVGKEDGVVRWVAARGKGLFDGDRCVRAIGSVIDITRPRRDLARQQFLLALSDDLRGLGDARSILEAAMVRLGRELAVNRAGFGIVEDDGATIVIATPYVDGAAKVSGTFATGTYGPAALARQQAGQSAVVDDFTASAAHAATFPVAAGVRAFVSVPLLRHGVLRATMFVHRTRPGAWPTDDIELIEAVAARTWEAAERARAEAESQASEARLRAVIAAAPIGLIFATAPDGRIVGGNAQAEELLRHPILPSPDIDHYNEWVSFHPDGRRVTGREYPLARALAGEERPELETLYRRGDGSEAWLRFVAAPVRGPDSEIVGGVVASIDIDRERRAELALRDLNTTLERRVEERTADLVAAQEALRQAQKMEAVGQLTGGIAHDFNNMLAIVLGSLDLLGRRLGADDVRARRYVEAATDGARRAATLTQRLLAFSRQQPLQPEPVDVNRLVAGMSDLLRGSLGGGVQLETVLAGGLWPVCVDPNQLENVILNLGINARDAMAGEGRVTIETHNCHLDDRYVAAEIGVTAGQYTLIAVTDAGAGMPPEVIAKAFDPFFTTKGVGKGTGLGLSQVYGFVRQSGGHVKIYSEVGVGTTVKLYLPRLVGGEVADPAPAGTGAPLGDARELILVVEDEPGVRTVTVESLRELGYRVVEVDNAAAALRVLAAEPDVALLFTDIVMPETNGARLAEAARALRPDLKVLFTTGYTRNAVVHNGVVDAGVELIGKPFTFDALAAKVRRVLDGG